MASSFKIESGAQLLARLSRKPQIEGFYPILFEAGPKQGEVIEMLSDCNINYLLDDIICEALLTIFLEKRDIGILIFNCSGHFNYEKLLSSLKNKIMTRVVKKDYNREHQDFPNDILEKILNNFFVTEIFDANQLYITIHNLENIYVEHPNIAMIIFDSITAFYWSEQNFKITKMDLCLKKILQLIQKVTREYKTTILYTKPDYFKSFIDNVEPYSETLNTEKITYRVQITQSTHSKYKVNVRTSKDTHKKEYFIEDNIINWVK